MQPFLTLADVHRLTTRVAGRPVELFLFDHHRTAFTLWSLVAQQHGPATLVTLDRHMDLGTPKHAAPAFGSPIESLDAFARHQLAPTNDDHIVAALEAGALTDAVVVARSHQPPSLDAFEPYRDAAGRLHRFAFARSLELLEPDAGKLVAEAERVVLDIDLDCFTTLSDGHVGEVLTWDRQHLADFLLAEDAAGFWKDVLAKVVAITIAREPFHCGGFERAAKLWLDFSAVFFGRLLQVDAP